MGITSLFTIAEREKALTCPSVDEWVTTSWHMHMREYYSAITRNEVLIHITVLENVTPSKRSETPNLT